MQGPDTAARPGTSIALEAALARARGDLSAANRTYTLALRRLGYFDGKRTYQMRSILVGAAEARTGGAPVPQHKQVISPRCSCQRRARARDSSMTRSWSGISATFPATRTYSPWGIRCDRLMYF